MFHEVLPHFVKKHSIWYTYSETLDSHQLVEYYISGKSVREPFMSSFTHLQTFRHCMRVIQSTYDCNVCPKFMFVGTHEDLEYECTLNQKASSETSSLQG